LSQPKIVNSKAKLREWYQKWQKIRDNATTPAIRSYAEQYLDMLRRQLKAEHARLKEQK
jgi:hemerythrin-like domain-containing protein